MGIVVNLDVMMAKRKMGLTELAAQVDITMANLSILKNNKAKAIRFSTLEAICKVLACQPGDILEYEEDADDTEAAGVGAIEILETSELPEKVEIEGEVKML